MITRPFRAGAPTRTRSQRYTEAEIEALCEAARRAGIDVGSYVRRSALDAAKRAARKSRR